VVLAPLGTNVGDYAPWANFVHHNLAPVALLVDWLLFPPGKKLSGSTPLLWLLFPIAYFTFTVIRGPGADFYPYPFMNPDEMGGFGGVVLYAAGILLLFWVTGLFIRWWADKRGVIPESAAA
jgi:hypothetical protein